MWKPIAAGAAALLIAGSTIVYAQNQNRPGREGLRNWRPSVEDMRAFGEARLAGLKAGLTLTAEQEKSWPAFEQAAREFTKLRIERMNAAANTQPPAADNNPAERLNRRATAMVETGNALKKLSEATGPLYNSLDESQKRRFAMLSRLGRLGGDEVRGRDGRPGMRGMMRRTEGFEGPSMQDHPMLQQHRQIGPMQRSLYLSAPIQGEEKL
jgi:zinc resistance-associated protein